MANKDGHRRFGNVRRLPSGRYQIRYPGPDGRIRTGPETYERKGDADRALVLVESDMRTGRWTDPERGRVKLADYAATWVTERPGLRPRTADNYRWLLKKHVSPHLGAVPVGKLSTPMIREWRATLLRQRCLGLDGGQGIPLSAGRAHDGGRGGQDPSPEPVPYPGCGR